MQHEQTTIPASQHEFDEAKAQFEKNATPPAQHLHSIDLARLTQEANELATLAQSVPLDVDQTAKGLLPKDLDPKLKRIEKLAKQLRSRISR